MSDQIFVRCRILIVDDEEVNLHLMRRTLATAGYTEVKSVNDPRDVLDVVRTWNPDLVLLDLHMPHLDGITVLFSIRAALSSLEYLPVIVLTADSSHDALVRAMNAGANDFLTKPFHLDEVLLRVRNLLAVRLSHEALKDSNSALATTLRQQLQREDHLSEDHDGRVKAVRAVLEQGPTMVFQPIVKLATGDVVGFEALSRFDSPRPTDSWFSEAAAVGLGTELELRAIELAFDQFELLGPEEFMAVNVSPTVFLDDRFHDLIRRNGRDRVVVEITEHEPVGSYDELSNVCRELREDGIRIAIDDAGAGYASLRHILMLGPDVIKFDIALTRGVDHDPVKRALTASLLHFAQEVGAFVTAEGVETAGEFATLRALGVPWAQGFHIGYPAALADRNVPLISK